MPKALQGLNEPSVELLQLTVHVDTDGLKAARRGMLCWIGAPGLGRDRGTNQRRQARRCINGSFLAGAHQRASDAPGETLVTVLTQHARNLLAVRPCQPLGGALAASGIHAHVQRAVAAQTEASGRIVNLR